MGALKGLRPLPNPDFMEKIIIAGLQVRNTKTNKNHEKSTENDVDVHPNDFRFV